MSKSMETFNSAKVAEPGLQLCAPGSEHSSSKIQRLVMMARCRKFLGYYRLTSSTRRTFTMKKQRGWRQLACKIPAKAEKPCFAGLGQPSLHPENIETRAHHGLFTPWKQCVCTRTNGRHYYSYVYIFFILTYFILIYFRHYQYNLLFIKKYPIHTTRRIRLCYDTL